MLKVPGVLSGFPDWLVVEPMLGIRVVEAKQLQAKGSAFVPSQCSAAQRLFLNAVARHGGAASVLVLGPDHYAEFFVGEGGVKAVSRGEFYGAARPYTC